jgi:UDP-N-acetylglucosamine 2-epimerase (non-hydrolysing)
MIDALQQFLPLAQQTHIINELGLIEMGKIVPFGLLTLHRPANVDATDNLSELLTGIRAVADQIPIIFPVHPRTQLKLNALTTGDHPGLRMIAPLGYLEFLSLLNSAKLVLTDSGGIQEETTALGVPCLTLRENTERPVTVSQGTNLLVGTDPAKILTAATAILAGKGKTGTIPRLWDGHAAERIVDILVREIPD